MREVEGRVRKWGELGQWIGMAAAIAGLVIEIVLRADFGYALLTGGSLAWGIFTKVKYYGCRREENGASHNRLR